jgi:glycosyltransferase involved in cell wall biosynthesis
MRLLHISSGKLFGGVETALITLARCRHLCPGMEQHFALSFEGRLSRELEDSGAEVHQLGEVRTRTPWTIWNARRRLRDLLSREPFDIVICHMSWPLAIFGKAVRQSRSRLAFWAHDASTGRHWLDRWARRVPPDLVIGNSFFTQGTVAHLFPHAPCTVIYPPSTMSLSEEDKGCRAAVRKHLDVDEETVVIIQVSRMEGWKGHRLHLEALGKLKENANWICWMVGGAQRPAEQQYMQSIQQQAAQLGIADRVRFLGQRSDVPRLLAAADVFCQPNLGPEPFGLVFVEALSARLPVVTTAMGGPQEIIDASCGIVVPPGQADQLADALRRLIDSSELRAALGQRGPQRARELCDPGLRMSDLYEVLERVSRN